MQFPVVTTLGAAGPAIAICGEAIAAVAGGNDIHKGHAAC